MAEFPLLHLGASAFEAMFATHLSDLCGFFKLRGLSEEMLATGILAGEWLSWEAPGGGQLREGANSRCSIGGSPGNGPSAGRTVAPSSLQSRRPSLAFGRTLVRRAPRGRSRPSNAEVRGRVARTSLPKPALRTRI